MLSFFVGLILAYFMILALIFNFPYKCSVIIFINFLLKFHKKCNCKLLTFGVSIVDTLLIALHTLIPQHSCIGSIQNLLDPLQNENGLSLHPFFWELKEIFVLKTQKIHKKNIPLIITKLCC